MLEVLRDCGALARILPELDVLWGVPQPEKWHHPKIDTGIHILQVIDCAAQAGHELPTRASPA
jgi:tRNA nucleotidyltransferase (CCA-adding enzyme)